MRRKINIANVNGKTVDLSLSEPDDDDDILTINDEYDPTQYFCEIDRLMNIVKNQTDMLHKIYRNVKRIRKKIKILEQENSKLKQELHCDNNCSICFEFSRNHAMIPCGHKITCGDCAAKLLMGSGHCPVCRKDIIDILQVYDS